MPAVTLHASPNELPRLNEILEKTVRALPDGDDRWKATQPVVRLTEEIIDAGQIVVVRDDIDDKELDPVGFFLAQPAEDGQGTWTITHFCIAPAYESREDGQVLWMGGGMNLALSLGARRTLPWVDPTAVAYFEQKGAKTVTDRDDMAPLVEGLVLLDANFTPMPDLGALGPLNA